jgi:hypothetical protein
MASEHRFPGDAARKVGRRWLVSRPRLERYLHGDALRPELLPVAMASHRERLIDDRDARVIAAAVAHQVLTAVLPTRPNHAQRRHRTEGPERATSESDVSQQDAAEPGCDRASTA